MYSIQELEDAWKRYDRKRRRPKIIAFVLFVVAVAIVSVVYSNREAILKSYVSKKKDSNVAATAKKAPNALKSIAVVNTTAPKMLEDKPITTLQTPSPVYASSPLQEETMESVQDMHREPERKKIRIEMTDAKDSRTLRKIAKRFKLSHDVEDSLFLAKAYYEKRAYAKAEYWALQTNKINDEIEESWLIFAKAKYKRGHRNEAMRILKAYIKGSDSLRAKILLEKMKKRQL